MTLTTETTMPETGRDAGGEAPHAARRRPQRRCIVTRGSGPKTGLLRCVVGPDGVLTPDAAERLPGRGYWVTAARNVIETAIRKRSFEKVANGSVTVPADLADRAADQVERQCLALLGLARGAGQVVTGDDRVAAVVERGRAGVVFEANDAAGARRRRDRGETGGIGSRHGVPVVRLFDRDRLSAALGGGNVVHAAVEKGGMAERILRETTRLEALRPTGDMR